MTKKFKIKDLEAGPDERSRTRIDYTKISLDDLADEVSVTTPQFQEEKNDDLEKKVQETPKTKNEVKEKVIVKPSPVEDKIGLDRNLLSVYVSKVLSFLTVFIILDFTIHFLKFFESIDVLRFENYDSIFIQKEFKWNVITLLSFLSGVFFMTSDEKLHLCSSGIQCTRVEVLNMFFTSRKMILPWQEIVSVKYRIRFFEPYLFFYGENSEFLGQVRLSLKSPKDFFLVVENYAGKNHPLSKIRSEIL